MKPFEIVSNAIRAKEILTVLARHGFADWIEQLDLPPGLLRRLVRRRPERLSPWERIRMAAEELGPTFVKFGQLLSTRPDILPQPLILELRRLQDQVAAVPFDEMRPVLEEQLERPIEELFTDFSPTPAATGSLAQVYWARFREDGTPVAVKVQRPNLEKVIETDFDLIEFFANQAHQRIQTLRPYDLPSVVKEIHAGIRRELDFRNEARNQQFFNVLNPNPEHIFAPTVFNEWTTRRLLLMERVEARRIESTDLPPEEAKEIARRGAASLLHQILIAGFFHADPHGGNILLTSDHRLCLLDWGLVGHLTRRFRLTLAELITAAASQDPERIVQIAADLAGPGAKPDYRTMEKEVTLVLRETFNFQIGKPQVGHTVIRLLHILGSNGIDVTRDYSLMAKAVLSIEETGFALDPDFDLQAVIEPILYELQAGQWKPESLWRRMRNTVSNTLSRLQELPTEIERILRRVEQDDLTINFQHRGLEDLDDAVQSASNRITLGLIVGSLIVGSSMVITTGIRPHIFGYPALGIVGFSISALLGLWIAWDIVRHGRHR